MDRHLAVIVLVIVVVTSTGMTLSATTTTSPQPDDDSSMGNAVSSFMQVSVVEADSTVNREMWEASFENADNESEKTALLKQRSNRLSQELSSIRAQQKQLNGNGDGTAQARTDALSTQMIELRESIGNVSQTANESNVSNPKLSSLRTEACTVNMSNNSSIVSATKRDTSGLCSPDRSVGNSSDGIVGNDTDTGTPESENGTVGNDTDTETPESGNGTDRNDTETGTPGSENGTDQLQPPRTETQTETGTPDPDNRTETETEPGPPTGTSTPQTPAPTPNGTDTPTETVPTNNTNTIEMLR